MGWGAAEIGGGGGHRADLVPRADHFFGRRPARRRRKAPAVIAAAAASGGDCGVRVQGRCAAVAGKVKLRLRGVGEGVQCGGLRESAGVNGVRVGANQDLRATC